MSSTNASYSLSIACALLLTVMSVQGTEIVPTLPLQCNTVPKSQDQICVIRTESRYGPYDQVAYYHIDKNQHAYLLGSEDGGVGTFGGIGFSDGGKYMWLGWAEEGHPHFTFYLTRQFIANGINTKGVGVLGEYEFQWFLTFSDSGLVRYEVNEEICQHKVEGAHYWTHPGNGENFCAKVMKLTPN